MKYTPPFGLINIGLLLNRLSLGLYFVLAGIGKVKGGVAQFVEGSFATMTPDWLPEVVARPYGYSIPYLEIILGAMLVLGLLGRVAAGLLFLMLVSITIALSLQMNLRDHGPGPFSANIIYITLAFLLMVVGPGRLSIDGIWSRR